MFITAITWNLQILHWQWKVLIMWQIRSPSSIYKNNNCVWMSLTISSLLGSIYVYVTIWHIVISEKWATLLTCVKGRWKILPFGKCTNRLLWPQSRNYMQEKKKRYFCLYIIEWWKSTKLHLIHWALGKMLLNSATSLAIWIVYLL